MELETWHSTSEKLLIPEPDQWMWKSHSWSKSHSQIRPQMQIHFPPWYPQSSSIAFWRLAFVLRDRPKIRSWWNSLTLKAQINKNQNTEWTHCQILFHRMSPQPEQFSGPIGALPSRGPHCSQSHLHFPRGGWRCSQNLGKEASPAAQTLVTLLGRRDGLCLSSYELFLKERQDEKLELESFKARTTVWNSDVLEYVPLTISRH